LTYTLNRLSSFQNLRRKGDKFDHRPERPKVLLYTPLGGINSPIDSFRQLHPDHLSSARRALHLASRVPDYFLSIRHAVGVAENSGPENAGPENEAPNVRT